MEDAFNSIEQKEFESRSANFQKQSKSFWTQTFYLDDETPYNLLVVSRNKIDNPFRSFWIYETSDTSFNLEMVVRRTGDDIGKPIPLFKNFNLDFGTIEPGARLQWTAQAGKWVKILFASSSAIQPGFVNVDMTGQVTLTNGGNFTEIHPTNDLTTTPVQALASSSTRKVGWLCNYSGANILYGTNASCMRILPPMCEMDWRNSATLYWRAQVGTINKNDLVIFEETE